MNPDTPSPWLLRWLPQLRAGQTALDPMRPITGSIVALVTPMHEDGSVDYATLRRLIDWHIAEGTDCIGVVGTTGESPTVSRWTRTAKSSASRSSTRPAACP
jgi:hypothetical protein